MLAFLGGTGPEGKGLALRLAMAGQEVIIGSRSEERTGEAAASLKELAPQAVISGRVNAVAAQRADTVFVTVPFDGQKSLLQDVAEHLTGKVVITAVAPMVFLKGKVRALPVEEGSAAQQAQQILPDSRVVAAFQNISAVELMVPDRVMDGDVVVCSDHQDAKDDVMELVRSIRDLRPVDGGALENAKYVEQFTAMLVNINRIYKCHSMIKIIGI